MKSLNLEDLINAQEMNNKIQGFDYKSSIINKINASKFINTFEAKISFILQYVCLLELYFGKKFLSCLREELMMEDNLSIRPLTTDDMNPEYFLDSAGRNDSSFVSSNSSSKLVNKMIINPQYSISEMSNTNKGESSMTKSKDLGDSVSSLPNTLQSPNSELKERKVAKLEDDINELSSIIPINPTTEEFRSNPELISRLERLKDNPVAKMISSLSKENEVFKKCLNQMIKNEENFTKLNNEIYFDDNGEIRRRSTSLGSAAQFQKDKENCAIMWFYLFIFSPNSFLKIIII